MPARFAIVPSIEKTPSVAIIRNRAEAAAFSCASRSPMSEFLKRNRCALHRRMPSMMLAWFNWSLMTASSSESSASKSPPFASKQEE